MPLAGGNGSFRSKQLDASHKASSTTGITSASLSRLDSESTTRMLGTDYSKSSLSSAFLLPLGHALYIRKSRFCKQFSEFRSRIGFEVKHIDPILIRLSFPQTIHKILPEADDLKGVVDQKFCGTSPLWISAYPALMALRFIQFSGHSTSCNRRKAPK
jgi:hypothetical protein